MNTDRPNPREREKGRLRRRRRGVAVVGAGVLLVSAAVFLGGSGPRGEGVSGPVRSSVPAVGSTALASSSATARPPYPSEPAVPGRWRLVFADDFAGEALDASRWVTCYDWNVNGCTNAGNRELEWYAPSQVTVGGGAATLSSVRKPTVGGDGRVYSWASGMLSTGRPSWAARPRFTFTYGYVEASIRMPAAAGMFPAFWLLTGDETVRPEVDIAELIASHTHVLMNLHWTTSAGTHASAPRTFGPVDFSAGYHDFAVDWEPSGLTWYVDGIARYAVTDRLLVPARPMELLFTLAVGFPGPPPADVSTASMSIEHVRIWQR